ncbi:MAG: hypothetical protein LBU04_06790 [Christensenellaceae bacterium]|jgi:hypothetical protein|nr:hypothetical protein [Christensenellaceae bacterium]
MNTDKAYLLGLIIGGGVWGNAEDNFRIKLPFKQWGSYEKEPNRAGQISRDIMNFVSPLIKSIYGLSISYDATASGEWNILCDGDYSNLQADLEKYGIVCEGELRKNAEINKIIPHLVDDNMKRRFVAGLADTIGSTKNSHRRFTDDKQMISFEFPGGSSYYSICALSKLLHSIKCYPDQMTWNHPNLHCSKDPHYKQWSKGFKLRVLSDQYADFGAFSFASKAQSLKQNRQLEKEKNIGETCEAMIIESPNVSCVHPDEYSESLPPLIKDGHYLHNRHICAVMGCEHAPYNQISALIATAEQYINPFPVLTKGTRIFIASIVQSNKLYSDRTYSDRDIEIAYLFGLYKENARSLLFGSDTSGYPVNEVANAIAFLVAAKLDRLNGNRPRGNMDEIIQEYLAANLDATVKIYIPDLLTPIILSLDNHAAIVGANNPAVYKKLISKVEDNEYKIIVRSITEDDLK